MSKVLLINPHFNLTKAKYDSSVSVGLLSIISYLRSKGIDAVMLDAARQDDFWSVFESEIKDCAYVGISVMTMQIPGALKISKRIRELNPQCKIVWGGSHPTFFIEHTAAHPLVDAVGFGEGELTMLEIVNGKKWDEIKGLAYKKNGKVLVNPPRELHDPSKTSLFNWDAVPLEILKNLSIVPSLTSRGCPHRCTFCINAILKNKWRQRSAGQVLEDIRIIKNHEFLKGKPVRFWDENFFVDIKRAREIVSGMITDKLAIPWETTIRVDYIKDGAVDGNFLADLRKSGCYLLSFGAESGSPDILKKIKKDVTPEQIVNSAKMCLKHGITPQYSFMIGLPGESRSDMMMTIDLIGKLIALGDGVQILGPQAFRPYPGSVLYEECLASGWKAPVSLDEWAHLAENEINYLSVGMFPWVNEKDLVESMEAYVRFGAHSVKNALGSSVKAHKFLKLIFVLICKLRWKAKFFKWPVEYKLAKKYITLSGHN